MIAYLPALSRPSHQGGAPRLQTSEKAAEALVGAFGLLARHGTGMFPWATSFRHDPIAFLLDTIGDAANLWGSDGELLYQNRAASELGKGCCDAKPLEEFSARGRRFERRCIRCDTHGGEFILEVIHDVTYARERNDTNGAG
jgi:hypothetical protein